MSSKVFSAANTGFNGKLVDIECDITGGLPGIIIIGIPNKTIDGAKERMKFPRPLWDSVFERIA